MDPKHRVVVTGMGIVSGLGTSLDEVSASLQAGRSCIREIPERVELGFRCPLSGVLPEIDPGKFFKRKVLKSMNEGTRYGAVAAMKMFEECSIDPAILATDRAGVIFGNDSSADTCEFVIDDVRENKTTSLLGSGAVVRSMNSCPTINLGPLFKTRGASFTLSAACSSSAHALGISSMLIASGLQDMVLTGGIQELCWSSMAAFDALQAFSIEREHPEQASRPFDRNRTGLVPGGGGATLLLESLEHARERRADIHGEILGYTFTSDGTHVTQPSADGARRCIQMVLDRAGIRPDQVDYISAHATSTTVGDRAEVQAIRDVFGEAAPPVSSTKSMTGHECWMAGASETIYALLMMRDGFIAPNINFVEQEPDAPRIPIVAETRKASIRLALKNSFGFGGTNACLLLGAFDE